MVERYGEQDDVDEPERLHADGLAQHPRGRDRAAARPAGPAPPRHPRADAPGPSSPRAPKDCATAQLLEIATSSNAETTRQLTWLTTRMKQAAPQALIVAP